MALVAVRENQDFDFRKRVAAAIATGSAGYATRSTSRSRSWSDSGGDERNYGSGRLALGLLTLVHGHVPADDAVLQKGFAELRRSGASRTATRWRRR
jgi:hypothetical protein